MDWDIQCVQKFSFSVDSFCPSGIYTATKGQGGVGFDFFVSNVELSMEKREVNPKHQYNEAYFQNLAEESIKKFLGDGLANDRAEYKFEYDFRADKFVIKGSKA